MLKLSLCDHSDNYIIIKKTITVVEEGADLALHLSDRHNKQVVFDQFSSDLFTCCKNELRKTEEDNEKHLYLAVSFLKFVRIQQ